MGCNAKKFQIQTAEGCGLFSSLFLWAGRLFANCSNLPQRIATIVWHNKGALRENGTDLPHNLRKVLPAKAHAGTFSCGCGRSSGAQQAHKKLSPVSMRGNSQNGGQTTKSLLTKPQCSGVPIQQAVSLSSSFPRHCLLFVCAFFREIQAVSRSECCLAARSPACKKHHRYSAQNSRIEFYAKKPAKIGFLRSFCRSSTNFATDLLQTTEKGGLLRVSSSICKSESVSLLRVKKHVGTRKSRLPFQVNGLTFGGAFSTALEPKTSSRVTILASSVKLKLSTTRSSKT